LNNDGFTPWLWYPELWATKSKFYTWLRGSLRKAVWNTSPIKITFKNKACSPPPEGYTGRAKSGAYCALSGDWDGKSALQVDHIVGNVSLQDEGDILDFIKHLIPPPNSLQLVTKEAHKIKSHAEKQGITYQVAYCEKQAIDIIKQKKDVVFLKSKGITPESNAKKRRQQLVEYFKTKGVGKC